MHVFWHSVRDLKEGHREINSLVLFFLKYKSLMDSWTFNKNEVNEVMLCMWCSWNFVVIWGKGKRNGFIIDLIEPIHLFSYWFLFIILQNDSHFLWWLNCKTNMMRIMRLLQSSVVENGWSHLLAWFKVVGGNSLYALN